MNSLGYAGTTSDGNVLLQFPIFGHVFYFEELPRTTVTLKGVTLCDDVERQWDETAAYEDLPAPAKRVLTDEGYQYRGQVSTVTGAMT